MYTQPHEKNVLYGLQETGKKGVEDKATQSNYTTVTDSLSLFLSASYTHLHLQYVQAQGPSRRPRRGAQDKRLSGNFAKLPVKTLDLFTTTHKSVSPHPDPGLPGSIPDWS